MTPEIVILAMIAAFLGLRLYSVLGRRAEHEEEPIQGRFEGRQGQPGNARVPVPPKADGKQDAKQLHATAQEVLLRGIRDAIEGR